MNIGTMKSSKPIEVAMREIKEWLTRLGVNGLGIDLRYDASSNVALLRFKFKEKTYEFRSSKQKNCRLNMFGIARVMEFKVRAHLMGIEDFGTSMQAYLSLEDKTGTTPIGANPPEKNEINYIKLGVSPLASNDEIKKKYLELMKTFHPDMALSEGAKTEFTKRVSEVNEAWAEIKKERGI